MKEAESIRFFILFRHRCYVCLPTIGAIVEIVSSLSSLWSTFYYVLFCFVSFLFSSITDYYLVLGSTRPP